MSAFTLPPPAKEKNGKKIKRIPLTNPVPCGIPTQKAPVSCFAGKEAVILYDGKKYGKPLDKSRFLWYHKYEEAPMTVVFPSM